MPGTTPIFGWRFQELGDPPHGANLGAQLAADAEATVNAIENRVDVLEAATSANLFKRKIVTTTRISTITLADDPELTVQVVPNTTYIVDGLLRYDSASAADFKMVLVNPAGSTFTGYASGLHTTAAGTNDDRVASILTGSGSEVFGGLGVGVFNAIHIHGNLLVGATAGTFAVQWAQNTSTASDTRLIVGSHLALRKVA